MRWRRRGQIPNCFFEKKTEKTVMQSTEKHSWRAKLQVDDSSSNNMNMNHNAHVLPSGVKIVGNMDIGWSKKKVKTQPKVQAQATKEIIIVETITFEGLNGVECKKWWAIHMLILLNSS